tara:strand:+ start:1954 stop:2379 length:426 start_codon:yes stop_codon:yes gene_type:complete
MEISKIHIDAEDYHFFTTLKDKEKIEFLHDVQDIGLNKSVIKRIEQDKDEVNESINDLFQDTMLDEIHDSLNRKMVITTMNNYIHMNSNSLKLIRQFIYKLFDDGHIIIRHKNAKKLDNIDCLRYYRCYEIIGTGDPICPN